MTNAPSRFVPGIRAEVIRIKAAVEDGRPVVDIRALEPLTRGAAALTVTARGVAVPVERVQALIEALQALLPPAEGSEW